MRDCASAVEDYINSIAGLHDFPKSIEKLVSEYGNANKFIIRDAQNVWKFIHESLKDIRHGNNEDISNLENVEVVYYIERLMSFVKYIEKIRVK